MKNAGYICFILVIGVIFFLVFEWVWIPLLDAYPPELPNDTEQWKANFEMWAYICVGGAALASLGWYIFGLFSKIDKWQDAEGKRLFWFLFFLIPIICVVISCLCVERAESGLWMVYLIFFFNGLVPYWLATALLSPPPFKYIPIGAKPIRSVCFW